MKTKGDQIVMILFSEDYLNDSKIRDAAKHADSTYILKEDPRSDEQIHGIKPIKYSGLLDILEKCDKVVSWT
ncbi:MAG: hypothetical protein ACUVV4_05820 [Candidatus Bathyarchaeia archaeon]